MRGRPGKRQPRGGPPKSPASRTYRSVSPGYVRISLVDQQIAAQAEAQGISEDEGLGGVMLASAALKRLVEPEEVAEMAAFLCTPTAASMAGASLTVDGGWSAR